MSKEKLIVIYAGNSIEAGLVKGLLEDAGIVSFLKDEIIGSIAPFCATPGGAGAVKVLVKSQDCDKARKVIEEFLGRSSDK